MSKKFWIIVSCFAIGLIGSPLYFWYQATRMPDWYSDRAIAANSIDLSDRVAVEQAQQTVDAKLANVQPSADGRTEVTLTGSELNALMASQVARIAESENLSPVVKRVSTNIVDGKIESGAVINLSKLPETTLNQREQDALLKLAKAFPGLSERDVYVGVEGNPSIQDGQLKLDGTHLRIGNLRLSISDVARQLGVSEDALRERLDREISLDRVGVQDVQLSDGVVKIRGTVN